MIEYFTNVKPGKIVLWCYLIWYLNVVCFYFDPSPGIWLNSLGICIVIGFALKLSVAPSENSFNWQTFRLFAMPFCVSSFSALIKGQGFILVVPPKSGEILIAVSSCLVFLLFVCSIKVVFAGKNA